MELRVEAFAGDVLERPIEGEDLVVGGDLGQSQGFFAGGCGRGGKGAVQGGGPEVGEFRPFKGGDGWGFFGGLHPLGQLPASFSLPPPPSPSPKRKSTRLHASQIS